MRLFGLIGYPLTQSFSKKYFEEKFEKEGLVNCRFENFPIESIQEFPHLVQANPDLEGLAVTIPYKQQVLPFLTRHEIPEGLKACNCIRIEKDEWVGYNTDCIGFQKSFMPLLQPHHTSALVLGNGGATAAVVYVLKNLGISYEIVSRSLHDQSTLTYDQLDARSIQEHTIVINTTPLGMYPDAGSYPPIPYAAVTGRHLFYDLVYNPGETLFLSKAREKGAIVKNGGDMLVLQAEENWRIWNL